MAPQIPAGAEFTLDQYRALKQQVASGVKSVRYENKGGVEYIDAAQAIQLLDRMERELQQNNDGPDRVLTRRTFYRRP